MRVRPLVLVLPVLLSGVALAGSTTPAKVERLAEEAKTDERSMQKLVKLLGSDDASVRDAAEAALVSLGTQALPALRVAVMTREDYAGAALVAIGKMGNPDTFDLLRAALDDAQLASAATLAWAEAERALWAQVVVATDDRIVDRYLFWFANGPHYAEAQRLRVEIMASKALTSLGPNPDAARLEDFVRGHAGTEAELRARHMLAEMNVLTAEDALRAGRPRDAMERIADAKKWDPTYDTRGVEGRARLDEGRALESAGKLDEAINAMEEAVALGNATASDYLSRYYLDRAQRDSQVGNLRRAMSDLGRVVQLGGSNAETAATRRDELVRTMFAEISAGGGNREEAAAALALAGSSAREPLRSAVVGRVAAGDPYPLRGVVSSLSGAGDESMAWLGGLLADAMRGSQGRAEALVMDAQRVEALLHPADVWAEAARAARTEALGVLYTYELSLQLARQHIQLGGRVDVVMPVGQLQSDDELFRALLSGIRPAESTLATLQRVQLLRHALSSCAGLEDVVRVDPARVALQFVGRPRLPADVVEWAILGDDARSRTVKARYAVPLASGGAGDLAHEFTGDSVRLVLRLPPGSAIDDGVVSDALTMLFGMARLVMATVPGIERFTVVVGERTGETVRAQSTFGVSRQDVRTMNWATVEAAAPYGMQHRALAPYREPR